MKKINRQGKRWAAALLTLTMILSLLPWMPMKASADGDQASQGSTGGTAEAIMNLDSKAPAEYDKYDTNVYGTGPDDTAPFLLSEQNELFLFRADGNSANAWVFDGFSMKSTRINSSGR